MLPLSDEYFRRIEAVEFTVKSDDGKEPRNFKKADLVLVGVSRTSKTPLSTLLAQRGLKVANLPLVLGVAPPPELEEAPQERIVGLTIGLDPLVEIRKARLKQLGMSVDASYGLREQVKEELEYAQRVFKAHPQLARHRRDRARDRGDRRHHPGIAEGTGRNGEAGPRLPRLSYRVGK